MSWIAAEFKPEECELIAYWLSRRVNGQPPRLADLDVAALKPWLPRLQIHGRLDDGYLCRLSGIECIEAIGSDSSGKRLDKVVPANVYASAVPMWDRTLAVGLPLRYRGQMALPTRGWSSYHRLLLPFSQQGPACDILLSRIEYKPLRDNLGPARSNTVLGSWQLSEADLRAAFPDRAAA